MCLLDTQGFKPPNGKAGYCGVINGNKHENCKCSEILDIKKCSKDCREDSACKGFSYAEKHKRCYLYTTNECKDNCVKKSRGSVGSIIHKKGSDAESGCYIKRNVQL